MENILNLIFDLDGCLIDSSEVQKAALFGSYREIVGDDDYPSYNEYIKYTGDSVDNVLAKLKLPVEMAVPFRRISAESIDKIVVNWESIELVKEFRRNGSKVAICTGKDHYRTVDILKYYDIEKYFDALICADDVNTPKPSAIPVLTALRELSCNKNDAVVIGDGYNDILSAKNAGVKSILTLWYGDNGVPHEADYEAETVDQLREILYLIACKNIY